MTLEPAVAPRRAGRLPAPGLALRGLGALVLAGAADWLFLRRPLGWTLGLYGFLLLTVLVLTQPAALRRRAGQVIAILLGGLVLASVIDPSPLAVLLGVGGVIAFALVARQGWVSDLGTWAMRYLTFVLFGIAQPFRDLAATSRLRGMDTGRRRTWRIAAWILPLGLGLVFLLLFAAANPVIARWTEGAGEALRHALEGLDGDRIAFWLVALWAAWALLRTRAESPTPPRRRGRVTAVASDGLLVRCLLVFNLLFLLQNGLDARYLWLGASLPEGMTYAQYAHRGAYPLVFTALLAAAFVLVTFRPGAAPGRWARRLVHLWLLQNVLLTVFAAWRLALYVEAYSLTRLRLAAIVWMGLVVCGLVLIAVRILRERSNRWLVGANAVAVFVVLYLTCFVDVAGFIASYNVRRCAEMGGPGEPIDLRYLQRLEPAALPAYERLAKEATDPKVRARATARAATVRADLEARADDWRAWSVRRQALLRASDD